MLEMKKIISIVLAIGVLMTAFSIAAFAETGTDVTNAKLYLYRNVSSSAGSAITSGTINYSGSGLAILRIHNYGGTFSKYEEGSSNPMWVKASMEIEPAVTLKDVVFTRIAKIYGINPNNEKVRIASLAKGENYKIDELFNLSTGAMYLYVNGIKVDEQPSTTFEQQSEAFEIQISNPGISADEALFELKSLKEYTYSSAQTLEDFEKEFEKETKVGIVKTAVVPQGTANSDGSYDITFYNKYDQFNWEYGEAFPLSGAVEFDQSNYAVKTQFVRLHTNIKMKSFECGQMNILMRGSGDNGNRDVTQFGEFIINDTKEHSLDVLFDVAEKKGYLYVDGGLVASGSMKDGRTNLTAVALKMAMVSKTTDVYTLSNVYQELYYNNPTDYTLEGVQATINTATAPVITGASVYYNSISTLSLSAGFAGYDEQKHNGYIVQYKNGALKDVAPLKSSTTIDEDTDTVKLFIWSKNGVTPVTDSFTAQIYRGATN